jgi:hypothetical protein
MVLKRPNLVVDVDTFRLLQDEVGIGKIVELSSSDASLVAPHIQDHPETIYTACSGVCLTGQYGYFQAGERQIAIEWVRKESKPQPNEPECNTYRYLFGLTSNGKCMDYDVTQPESSPETGQVADHWITFDEVGSG